MELLFEYQLQIGQGLGLCHICYVRNVAPDYLEMILFPVSKSHVYFRCWLFC
jgi:hypothetical protein